MSDIDASIESALAELDGAEGSEVNETEDVETAPAEETDQEAEVEDSEDLAEADEVEEPTEAVDDLVEVELDGQKYKVPAAIKDGYLRQADYTRKTQALAQQARDYAAYDALDRALAVNPEAALLKLAESYGVELRQIEDESFEDEYLDPRVGQELQELREWRAEQERSQNERRNADTVAGMVAELDALKTKYSANFDDIEVLQFAADNALVNLEHAYILWSQTQAPKPAAAPKKLKAVPPIEGGKARSPKTSQRGSTSMPSLDESLRLAAEELGITL